MSESGWDGIMMTNAGNLNTAQMEQYAQFIPRQPIFAAPPLMATGTIPDVVRVARTTFLNNMHQANIPFPDQTQVTAWDPAMIVIDALRHMGTNVTSTRLRDYILKLHGFTGVNGVYDFRRGDQRGLDPSSGVVARWDKAGSAFITISKPGGEPL